ncbi:hypothetical protein [Fulvimonas soli]|nr:hypothetical protein [Fulvimonas soli]HWA10410.1 hypothetical protein [Opitutaceae bacterium]
MHLVTRTHASTSTTRNAQAARPCTSGRKPATAGWRRAAACALALAIQQDAVARRPLIDASAGARFSDALLACGPSPELPASAAAVYGWLVGDWAVDVTDVRPDGSRHTSTGEWHFAWVLEGRAIQDVWIAPVRAQRRGSVPREHNRYGSSLRYYDDSIKAWRVVWINPVSHDQTELVARKVGDSVVQQSSDPDGTFTRWTFTDIKPASFTWLSEYSSDGGRTWQLDAVFKARRVGGNGPCAPAVPHPG